MARDDDEGVPLPTEAEQQPMADRPPIRHTPRRQGGREEEGRKVVRSRKMFASNPELHRRVTAFFGVCVLPFALLIAGAGVVFITVVPGKNPLMGMAFGIFSLLAGSLSFLVALRMIVGNVRPMIIFSRQGGFESVLDSFFHWLGLRWLVSWLSVIGIRYHPACSSSVIS